MYNYLKRLAFSVFFGITTQSYGEILWLDNFELAQKKAFEEKKDILVLWSTDWCYPCQQLKKQVLSNHRFIQAIKHLVPVKVDPDLKSSVSFSEKYQLVGFPILLSMTADGEVISRTNDSAGTLDSFIETFGDKKLILDADEQQSEVQTLEQNLEQKSLPLEQIFQQAGEIHSERSETLMVSVIKKWIDQKKFVLAKEKTFAYLPMAKAAHLFLHALADVSVQEKKFEEALHWREQAFKKHNGRVSKIVFLHSTLRLISENKEIAHYLPVYIEKYLQFIDEIGPLSTQEKSFVGQGLPWALQFKTYDKLPSNICQSKANGHECKSIANVIKNEGSIEWYKPQPPYQISLDLQKDFLRISFELQPSWMIYSPDKSDLGIPLQILSGKKSPFLLDKAAYPKPIQKDVLGTKSFVYDKNFSVEIPLEHKLEDKTYIKVKGAICNETCIPFEKFYRLDFANNVWLEEESLPENFEPFARQTETATQSGNIWYYLLLAVLGGLILNFMPCVLPVISLKLFGLISHKENEKRWYPTLAYTFGVLCSFWLLAFAVIFMRYLGLSVGWGFQMQSPYFVFCLFILVILFALSLLDVFEIPFLGKWAGNQINGPGKTSLGFDFLNGMFATLLSTPCSAPFLGTAVSFSLTAPSWQILMMFSCIGIGLALPFLLIGFFPSLYKVLPRPGMWMNTFKNITGYILWITGIWLFSVLISLTSSLGQILFTVLMTVFALFFGFYFRNRAQTWLSRGNFFMFFIFAVLSFANMGRQSMQNKLWKPFQLTEIQELQEKRKKALVVMTADWCLTCKINHKLVYEQKFFQEWAKKNEIELILGDFTQQNAEILQFITEHNLSGVPANFALKGDGHIATIGAVVTFEQIQQQFL